MDKTEGFLEQFSPKTLPLELQKKILVSAEERYKRSVVISPFSRRVLAISAVLIILVLFSDNMIKNNENDFLITVLNGVQTAEKKQKEEIQEVVNEFFNINDKKHLKQWLLRHYKVRAKSAGSPSYQSILDVLKE